MRFPTEIYENFRGRKILRSKSREIAPKSMPPCGAKLAHDPQRSPTTVPSVRMLRHVRLRAISDRNFRKIFAAAKFSREITPKSVPPDDAQPLDDPYRSPSTVPSVGTMWHVRFRAILSGFPTEIFEKFSAALPPNFAFEIA